MTGSSHVGLASSPLTVYIGMSVWHFVSLYVGFKDSAVRVSRRRGSSVHSGILGTALHRLIFCKGITIGDFCEAKGSTCEDQNWQGIPIMRPESLCRALPGNGKNPALVPYCGEAGKTSVAPALCKHKARGFQTLELCLTFSSLLGSQKVSPLWF